MIKGLSFDNQILTAKALRMCLSGFGDGILSGCSLWASGSTLTIGPGVMCASGAVWQITSNEQLNIIRTSGYVRVKAVVDLTGAATADSFNQVRFAVDASDSISGFPDLTQQNINTSGTTYEMELCVLSCGAAGITGIVRQAGNPLAILTKDMYGDELPANPREGQLFFKKA